MHLHSESERCLELRLSNEATLASFTAIAREVALQPVVLRAVHLRHPAPRSGAEHETYFGCPVHFGADRDALHVSKQTF